ncbi:MAG: SpoIID/LytB domain-containing protein [Oscillospiraceae bacterium]|nr:SpoIID/LytB domain-containing protein [Oscillospiraceae bacterium]
MKVRLLSLNTEKSIPFAKFQARVVSSLKEYTEGNETFVHYEKMLNLFEGFQNALQNDDIIVIAVDKKRYFKLKTAIAQAFEVENVQSPAVLNMLENNDSLSDEQRKDFASFPEPATVFLSKDGMYSGFGIDNGEKYIVVIPIDDDRINIILRNGVVPYLAEGLGGEVASILSETQHFDNEKVEIAISRLWETGSVVAVNGTANSEALKNLGEAVEHFNDVVVFTPHVEDKGEVNATEYAAQLARVSLDLSAANIGASISDIYETGESKYICIAVADDENATVRKLYLDDGETEEAFIESVAAELYELIGERAAGIRSVGIEVSDAPSEPAEPMEKKSSKKTVTILAIILGVVILLCAVLAVVFKMQGENGSAATALRKLFGYETTTESTTEPPTTQAPTTEPAPETNENKLKISDFIIGDILEIEKKHREEAEKPSESEPATNNTEGEEKPSEGEVEEDKGAPEFITVNGEKLPAKDAIAGLVMTEMGEGYEMEAIKAQAIVIYTYLKYKDNGFQIDGVQIEKAVTQEVEVAVSDVFGRYISYNGEVALTPFFEIAAGGTADASMVFSERYPYLRAVSRLDGNPEASVEGYENTVQLKRGEVQGILLKADFEIDVDSDPTKWIIVRERNNAVSSSVGYVKSVRVGGQDLTGYEFITKLSDLGIKSSCFKLSYDSSSETFTFTSYGVGCGVGMSKAGANALAGKGYNYERILKTYFANTTLAKEAN